MMHWASKGQFIRRKQQCGESGGGDASHWSWLFSKAFPALSGAADKNLLQQFKAGLSAEPVKTAVLRNVADTFAEAIKVPAQEERVGRELTMLKASVTGIKTDVDVPL
ncbi:hypothetical protein T07_14968 [Trichinella nelsoni]|uniref:Uncharacterized protein n=1 Tax=Trichinella nelsoni TaxID=6336 RepID=A0A0V0RIB1_9BILA|nr:hypothetical protein T07_14968 [Trichinella nelsoni]